MNKKTKICVCAIVVIMLGVIILLNLPQMKKENLTVELGDKISLQAEDYVKAPRFLLKNMHIFVEDSELYDVESMKTTNTGTLQAFLKGPFLRQDFVIEIKDTKAPAISMNKDITWTVGEEFLLNSYISNMNEASNQISLTVDSNGRVEDTESASNNVYLKYDEPGEYDNVLHATDKSGNISDYSLHITVVNAPVFENVDGFSITSGDKSSLEEKIKAITVKSDLDSNIAVNVDSSSVDVDKAGEYKIIASAVTSYGETFSKEISVKVVAPKKSGTTNIANRSSSNNTSSGDWVASLNAAQTHSQIITVAASGTSATVSMHNKNADGSWSQILSTSGKIGRNGIGKNSEGDGKTPIGIYGFSKAFGNKPNPGCSLGYLQVDDSYHWVDDSNSGHYNQLVSTNDTPCDWGSSEHIASVGSVYNYVLALDYNSACTPGKGSAIFLHCSSGRATAGCIAVPENVMVQIMQNVQPGCIIIIDSKNSITKY